MVKLKQINLILFFLFCFQASLHSQEKDKDTNSVFHLGMIPYQFCSRSVGAYVGYSYKSFGIEYRPTYTCATSFNYYGATADWFFFQGLNNNVAFQFISKKRIGVSLLSTHRYWWYNNTLIYSDKSTSYLKSSKAQGLGIGAEISFKIKGKLKEALFFINGTHTQFQIKTSTKGYNVYGGKINYYPNEQKESYIKTRFSMAIGFKLGWNNSIQQKKENNE